MSLFSSEYESALGGVSPAAFVRDPPATNLPSIGQSGLIAGSDSIGGGGVSRQITEEIVRCLWYGRHFLQERLYTEDGSRLEVLSPGRWNKEGGPDHIDAEILLEGGGHLKGDVEVHLMASDWQRHGHDKQEEYTRVRLHVVFWNDSSAGDKKGAFVKDIHGKDIPQLALSKYISLPVEELPGLLEELGEPAAPRPLPGPCQELLLKRTNYEQWLGHLLELAGDHRVIARAQRMEGRLKEQLLPAVQQLTPSVPPPLEELLYRNLMEALGYKNNVVGFSLLASRVSLVDLRSLVPVDASEKEAALLMQALFLGASSILQEWSKKDFQDEDGKKYAASLIDLWKKLKEKWAGEPLSPEIWRWEGTRPFNSPPRRLAAMSALLARGLMNGLFREFLSPLEGARISRSTTVDARPASSKGDSITGNKRSVRDAVKKLETIFLNLEDPFWSHHLTIGGNRLDTPSRLVGKERTGVLLVNVIIPLLLLYARRSEDKEMEGLLHEIYSHYPKLQLDSVVKFMSERIIPEKSVKIVNTARRQQGLHQIYRDFCQRGDVSCDKCGFYLALRDRGSSLFSW